LWVTYLLGILDEMTVAGYRFRKENVGWWHCCKGLSSDDYGNRYATISGHSPLWSAYPHCNLRIFLLLRLGISV
jgi:hypothetical protein